MSILIVAIFGALFGSFLSVCIYRIPYGYPKGPCDLDNDDEELEVQNNPEKISIVYPARSFCPSCNKQLLWWHNIPIISWLLLGGKCHFCKNKIGYRYITVEILSVFFAILSYLKFDPLTALVVYLFVASLIVLSFIDIEYYILPNVITYPSFVVALVLAGINHFYGIFAWPLAIDLYESFFGILAGAGVLFLVSEVYFRLRNKVGLGMGDVKLLAVVGALMGPYASFSTIFVGSFTGAILGIAVLLFNKDSFSKPLPFGPYLALGTILYIYLGPDFPDWFIKKYLLFGI